MGNCVCVHCGAEASSKCPYCRNVFPDNKSGYGCEVRQGNGEYGKRNGTDEFQLVFSWMFDREETATTADFNIRIGEVYDELTSHTREEVIRMFCQHTWRFKPEQSSTIGCGHGTPINPNNVW